MCEILSLPIDEFNDTIPQKDFLLEILLIRNFTNFYIKLKLFIPVGTFN